MKLKIVKRLDIAIEYLVYVLIFFIPISNAGISISAGLAVVLFLIKQILSPDFSRLKANKILFLILLSFFFFMALSLLNSGPLLMKSVKALCIKWGRFPLILWMILDTFRDPRRVINAAGVFVFSSTLVSLSVFSQKFFGLEFLRHRPYNGISVTGPFKNQNTLAAYLVTVIPVILGFSLWRWKQAGVRLGFFFIAALLILSSYWTTSRGSWVGLVAGLILLAFLINHVHLPKDRYWAMFSGSFLFFVPLAALALLLFQGRRFGIRITLLQAAWTMITENPFLGKGLGTYMDHSPKYINIPHDLNNQYAHNCYLQIWAESGIFSLLIFLLFAGYIFYKSSNVIFRIPQSLNSFILVGLSSGVLGYLVHSFFDSHLYSFQLSFLFWVTLGLTIALYSSLGQNQASLRNLRS